MDRDRGTSALVPVEQAAFWLGPVEQLDEEASRQEQHQDQPQRQAADRAHGLSAQLSRRVQRQNHRADGDINPRQHLDAPIGAQQRQQHKSSDQSTGNSSQRIGGVHGADAAP